LEIRKALDLYANIRPCYFPSEALIKHSPLKEEYAKGTEFIVMRELTGGIYYGDRQEENADGVGGLANEGNRQRTCLDLVLSSL
jgi:3-isopropylmalate dehydrogenase